MSAVLAVRCVAALDPALIPVLDAAVAAQLAGDRRWFAEHPGARRRRRMLSWLERVVLVAARVAPGDEPILVVDCGHGRVARVVGDVILLSGPAGGGGR